ncbi:stress response translation initiation inhibitor YciH [Desulfopila sp. IMCC35006]|nr:stress response translation initiation inhibitor YciH [Desulfopila sp. IMCC35006]
MKKGGELKKNEHPTVYSTDHGRIRPAGSKPQKSAPAGDGIVRIGRETKGRKGKGVTIISGVPLDATGLQALAQDLKRKCGSGGTVKEGRIEIQGDHREMLCLELPKRGWQVKRSGG